MFWSTTPSWVGPFRSRLKEFDGIVLEVTFFGWFDIFSSNSPWLLCLLDIHLPIPSLFQVLRTFIWFLHAFSYHKQIPCWLYIHIHELADQNIQGLWVVGPLWPRTKPETHRCFPTKQSTNDPLPKDNYSVLLECAALCTCLLLVTIDLRSKVPFCFYSSFLSREIFQNGEGRQGETRPSAKQMPAARVNRDAT